MTTSLPDDVRRMLSEYDFEVDDKSLICIICKRIIFDAFQSYCTCNYCYDCVNNYLSGENKYCLGIKEECTDEHLVMNSNIFRSAPINRKISQLKLRCVNSSCSSIIELKSMPDHIRICTTQTMPCPFKYIGCESEKQDSDFILNHLHNDTLTHSSLLIEYIQNLKNDINLLKDDFQGSKLEITSLNERLENNESRIMKLEEELLKKDEQINVLNLQIKKIEQATEQSKQVKVNINTLKEECAKYQEDTKSMLLNFKEEFDKIKTSEEIINQSSADALKRVDDLKDTIERMNVWTYEKVTVGEILYSLDKFSIRKDSKEVIYSSYFYSHISGYKLRLLVYPSGIGRGKGTHLSTYFIMCNGEYDDALLWPCKHFIKISVINQRNGQEHKSETFSYSSSENIHKNSFNKPIKKDNLGIGGTVLISITELQLIPGLIVNDVVLIKCTVSAPP